MQQTPTSRFWQIHAYAVMFLVCTLSVTTTLKVGEIQYLEILLAADLPILLWAFARDRFQVRLFRPFFSIGESYAIFLAVAFLLALLALRQDFTLGNETLLKRPLVVTISRMAELVLDVLYMLYLASCCREDRKVCIFGAKVYYWTAVAGALYSIVSFPLNYAWDLSLGTYGEEHRMRGFNNEGGSFGTYMVTVFALTFFMYRKKWLSRGQFYLGMGLFFVVMLGSQSKAGFFVLALSIILYLIWKLRSWQRALMIGTMTAMFVTAAVVLDIPSKIEVYRVASNSYQQVSNLRSEDGNFVMGRVAGAVLTPRMIAAHPLLGIGWGNYSLVRDNPEYRQGSAFSPVPGDQPGLGIIDYIVDLGFPLCLYLMWVLMKPAYLLRQKAADPLLATMAALHPIAVCLGTHLNLIYPWAIVALALGVGFNCWNAPKSAATPA